MNNIRLYKQVKDLHLGEWLLSQTPVEELDETKFTTESNVQFFGCPIHANYKTIFHWSI